MKLEKGRYLITGATGMIGSAIVRRFLKEPGLELVCPVRDIIKVEEMFDPDCRNKVHWIQAPLEDSLMNLPEKYDYIIHCAGPTSSKYFVEHPVETISFSISTISSLLNHAKNKGVHSFVYLSSLEVYGDVSDDTIALTENQQGYVNPLEPRSSYNMAKRICESLCAAYYSEYKLPVKIIRLVQTVPSFVRENDMRLYAQFARHAAKGEDIELHTDGLSARSYIDMEDAVEAILTVLYRGNPGEAYNAANEDTYISVKDLAKFLQERFNPSGKVVFEKRNDMGYAPFTKLNLDTSKLRSLGWQPRYGLSEMFGKLIGWLKDV